MAQTSLLSFLKTLLLLLLYTKATTGSALANPHPAPTALAQLAARQASTPTSAPPTTTTCTSTGFNSANKITTATGKCVVQACETATVGPDGRAMTNTGICTLTPIGAAAPRATRGMGVVAGAAVAAGVVYAAM